jgi:hypothetical protein
MPHTAPGFARNTGACSRARCRSRIWASLRRASWVDRGSMARATRHAGGVLRTTGPEAPDPEALRGFFLAYRRSL